MDKLTQQTSTNLTSALDPTEALTTMLDLGEALLAVGADVRLVGACLRRMGRVYGAKYMDVFVISSLIISTMTMPDGQIVTLNRRASDSATTNMSQLEDLFKLEVDYCEGKISLEDVATKTAEIRKQPFPRLMLYLGGILSTSCFAVFFGGTVLDGLVAALFSLLVCFMIQKVKPRVPNDNLFSFLAAFIPGIGIAAVCRALPMINMSMVIVGVIMITIPGIALTNSARDMITGDVVTGLMGLVESLLSATALALGFIAAIWIFQQIGAL